MRREVQINRKQAFAIFVGTLFLSLLVWGILERGWLTDDTHWGNLGSFGAFVMACYAIYESRSAKRKEARTRRKRRKARKRRVDLLLNQEQRTIELWDRSALHEVQLEWLVEPLDEKGNSIEQYRIDRAEATPSAPAKHVWSLGALPEGTRTAQVSVRWFSRDFEDEYERMHMVKTFTRMADGETWTTGDVVYLWSNEIRAAWFKAGDTPSLLDITDEE